MDYVPYDPAVLQDMADYILKSGDVIFGVCIIILAFVLLPSIVVRLAKVFTKH